MEKAERESGVAPSAEVEKARAELFYHLERRIQKAVITDEEIVEAWERLKGAEDA